MRALDPLEVPEVWRPVGATEEQGVRAYLWAAAHTGQPYDVGRFLFGLFRTKDSNICSTFAASAWVDSGFDISKGAGRWITPNDLASSGELEQVDSRPCGFWKGSVLNTIKGE
jgi:uncharacterized protein YycO